MGTGPRRLNKLIVREGRSLLEVFVIEKIPKSLVCSCHFYLKTKSVGFLLDFDEALKSKNNLLLWR